MMTDWINLLEDSSLLGEFLTDFGYARAKWSEKRYFMTDISNNRHMDIEVEKQN